MPTSLPLQPTITQDGLVASMNAQSTGIAVALTHIGYGTAQYVPDGDEHALVAEVIRIAIAGGTAITPTQLQIYAEVIAAAGAPFWCGEIGFFAGSILFAVYSRTPAPIMFISDEISTMSSYSLGLQALPAGTVTVTVDASISAAAHLIGVHEAAIDPHPQYWNDTRGGVKVQAAINALINAAPGTLDTLKELADALGDDPNFATTITNQLALKAPKGRLEKVVAGGVNVNLTAAECDNGILDFTGALTANIAVIVPNTNGRWDIGNRTTGNFTLTVKTAAGTGVLIAPGIPAGRVSVVCDATNVGLVNGALTAYSISALPVIDVGPIMVIEAQEMWDWVSTPYFTGYRSLLCGRPVDGHTLAPLANEVDHIGGLLSKIDYAGLWGYAQENGLVVTQAVWTANIGAHWFVDVSATQFRTGDTRNMFRRYTGTDADTANARALGSKQLDAIQDHSHFDWPIVGSSAVAGAGFSIISSGLGRTSTTGNQNSGRASSETRSLNTAYAPRIHV